MAMGVVAVETDNHIIKVKKLYPDALIPTRAYEHDAGWDLYAHHFNGDEKEIAHRLHSLEISGVHTGIAIAIPVGYVGLIFDRSSTGSKGISRLAGVIDSGYRGEIIVKLGNISHNPGACNYVDLHQGHKIAQLLIVPVPNTSVLEVNELPHSERDIQGFGSSGV